MPFGFVAAKRQNSELFVWVKHHHSRSEHAATLFRFVVINLNGGIMGHTKGHYASFVTSLGFFPFALVLEVAPLMNSQIVLNLQQIGNKTSYIQQLFNILRKIFCPQLLLGFQHICLTRYSTNMASLSVADICC